MRGTEPEPGGAERGNSVLRRRSTSAQMPGRGGARPSLTVERLGRVWQAHTATGLLEVLDPTHNHAFRHHHLEAPLNLSNVLFIATANQRRTIHPALLDRKEIIHLSSYTEEEKDHIAKMYLVPRQR